MSRRVISHADNLAASIQCFKKRKLEACKEAAGSNS